MNFTRKNAQDFVDDVDSWIRMAFSHYQQLAKDQMTRERAFRKADTKQIDAVKSVVERIRLEGHDPDRLAICDQEAPLAICDKDAHETNSVAPLTLTSSSLDPSSIFAKVLQKKSADSDGEQPEDCAAKVPKGAASSSKRKNTSSPDGKVQPFLDSALFSKSDQQILATAFDEEPIEDLRAKKMQNSKKKRSKRSPRKKLKLQRNQKENRNQMK